MIASSRWFRRREIRKRWTEDPDIRSRALCSRSCCVQDSENLYGVCFSLGRRGVDSSMGTKLTSWSDYNSSESIGHGYTRNGTALIAHGHQHCYLFRRNLDTLSSFTRYSSRRNLDTLSSFTRETSEEITDTPRVLDIQDHRNVFADSVCRNGDKRERGMGGRVYWILTAIWTHDNDCAFLRVYPIARVCVSMSAMIALIVDVNLKWV